MTEKYVLITGSAGFVGYHLANRLLSEGIKVVGYDNVNDYYEISLKEERLRRLEQFDNFIFVKGDLADKGTLENLFASYKFEVVINLAAQAGVRYSIDHPEAYIDSNIIGFFNVLECCRNYPVKHLLYASSSSVYGANKKVPFSVDDSVDSPVSLYAATKKSNELMAYCYSKLYGIPSTGLRFFTVYGPMGRPDMAYFSFAKKIVAGESIKVFNNGDMLRDFTYIDDIIEGIVRLIEKVPVQDENGVQYKVYNIGNNKPEKLLDFINILETKLGKEAIKEFYPMQPGDVYQTYADVDALIRDVGFRPKTSLEEGLEKFVKWFQEYYSV